jgi:type IV pilus assembly protein PilE
MTHTYEKARLHHDPVCNARRRQEGFSLIELMIVVAIVAILAAIAIPAYQRQVRQSRESAAKTALLDLARREETYYSTNNIYTTQMLTLGYTTASGNAIQVPNNTGEDYYSVTITPASSGTTESTYTATATPQGSQASDSCKTYSITNTGVQSATGSTPGGGITCW